MFDFNPHAWFWLAEDGRVFDSARALIVDNEDAAYAAWVADGGRATPWPRDDADDQTDAALQDVLTPYGMFIGLDGLKAMLRDRVDAAAERERGKYITAGAGQAMTYQQKAAEAKAFTEAETPVPADYPMLSAEVGVTAPDIAGVAASVLAAESAWRYIGSAIEGVRLGAKKGIDDAEDAEDAQAAADVTWPA